MENYSLKRKLNEICPEGIEKEEDVIVEWEDVLEGKELIEKRDTMVLVLDEGLDQLGAKLVFVDWGSYGSKEYEADQHINSTMLKEGRLGPRRLIFVKQDKDFWPGSEKDSDVIARRAAKQMVDYDISLGRKPDFLDLFVPPTFGEYRRKKDCLHDSELLTRLTFKRYFDPSLPGTQFIVQNMDTHLRGCFRNCMRDPELRSIWLNSPLAGIIQLPSPVDLQETKTELELGLECAAKFMKDEVNYYPGSSCKLEADEDVLHLWEDVLEGKELEKRDTMVLVLDEGLDHVGGPGAKLVFVDWGSYGSKEYEADQHINTMLKEGKPGPRLIFVKQDKDFWPGSEKDSDVITRRAAKQMVDYDISLGRKPDFLDLFVPPTFGEYRRKKDCLHDSELLTRLTFNRYFDPSLPGTQFIVQNMDIHLRGCFDTCMRDPELRSRWLNSPLAGIIQLPVVQCPSHVGDSVSRTNDPVMGDLAN